MISLGKHITQRDDLLTVVDPKSIFELVKQPEDAVKEQVIRLRLVRTIDKNQYGLLKRQLPYLVCGIFNPPYRRIENFGCIGYFIVDIDHITEKGLDINALRAKIIADNRTMLCFVSPGEDGLKVMFRLKEKCYDAGQYSLFYKAFIQILAVQYNFEQVVDKSTSDVSRACFMSYDPDAYFNPEADAVEMKDFVDFDNPFSVKELEHDIKKEEKEKANTEKPEKAGPDDAAIAFIKERLQVKSRMPRSKPQVYVPEQLDQILEKLLAYIAEVGVQVVEVSNIQYGKKFKFRAGIAAAEVNLFFGRRGFSVVKSSRQGTADQLNELMVLYIKTFIDDYTVDDIEIHANPVVQQETPEPDYENIRQQANLLHAEKKYTEALALYRTLWEDFHDSCTEWDGWRYATCLKQLKDYKRALDICRQTYLMNRDFEPVKSLYAWCIYYTEIASGRVLDESVYFRAAEAIMQLSRQNDKYSAYTVALFKVMDYLNGKNIYPIDKILVWTSRLDPGLLEEEPFKFTDREGKQREMASKKEQYYMWRTRALLEKGLFDDCTNLCNEALSAIKDLHYDNDVWFRWRIALCHEGKGELAVALDELKALLGRKKEWFIQKEIAGIYLKQGNHEQAISYAIDSALNAGDSSKKLNLYRLLAEILIQTGKIEEAKAHVEFSYHLKVANGYRIDDNLVALVGRLRIDTSKTVNINELENRLRKMWNGFKFDNREQLTGAIKTILPNGKAGFIRADNGKSYYFQLRNFKSKTEAAEGLKVKFFTEEGFDVKKSKATVVAVNIRILT
jgi:tetratricopeptide (TPR) repeat protein